jgi:hypothetical protein
MPTTLRHDMYMDAYTASEAAGVRDGVSPNFARELLGFFQSRVPLPCGLQERSPPLRGWQFGEICRDIYDVFLCRERHALNPNGRGLIVVPTQDEFPPHRNQTRQKLAELPRDTFDDLASEIFFRLNARYSKEIGFSQRESHEAEASNSELDTELIDGSFTTLSAELQDEHGNEEEMASLSVGPPPDCLLPSGPARLAEGTSWTPDTNNSSSLSSISLPVEHSISDSTSLSSEPFSKHSKLCLDGQITRRSIYAVASGGHADIWIGSLGSQSVAIKIMRLFNSTGTRIHKAKLLKVGSRSGS